MESLIFDIHFTKLANLRLVVSQPLPFTKAERSNRPHSGWSTGHGERCGALSGAMAPRVGGIIRANAPPTSPGSDRSVDWNSALAIPDDLSREVYCILGMPIDAIEMPAVMQSIEMAAANAMPFVISTPNINFLVNSQNDPEFRESAATQ